MNLFGLQTDTHMVGKQYSYLTVLFCRYNGYIITDRPKMLHTQSSRYAGVYISVLIRTVPCELGHATNE